MAGGPLSLGYTVTSGIAWAKSERGGERGREVAARLELGGYSKHALRIFQAKEQLSRFLSISLSPCHSSLDACFVISGESVGLGLLSREWEMGGFRLAS